MPTELVIGTTWTEDFLKSVENLNKQIREGVVIAEVYGSIRNDLFGTARERDRLPKCDYDSFRDHITHCHDIGVKVSYANNTLCIGSSHSMHTHIEPFLAHLEMLKNAGIDSIIFANPFYVELSKKNFPSLVVIVSSAATVDSARDVVYFQRMGVDRVILPPDENRNFKLLNTISEFSVELLLNETCVFHCPYRTSHFAMQSHDSVSGRNQGIGQYPYDSCWQLLTENWPAEFLKSRWIRPEDLHLYEDIGIKSFKLSGRTMPEQWILRTTEAYMKRAFDGNLAELAPLLPGNYDSEGTWPITVPNKKLDGFLEYFLENGDNCRTECGFGCNYCEEWAKNIGYDK